MMAARTKGPLVPALKHIGLGPMAFDSFVRGLSRAAHDRDANLMMTQVYLLLTDPAVLTYDPNAADWLDRQVRKLSKFIRLHGQAHVRSLTHEHLIHATAHRLLQMLRAAGQPVPNALLDLAQVQQQVVVQP